MLLLLLEIGGGYVVDLGLMQCVIEPAVHLSIISSPQ
jgi:hypothetical protein